MTWYLRSNHVRFIQDWGSDLLIEELCPNAVNINDSTFYKCVDRKVGSMEMPQTVVGLSEQIRELLTKVTELETEITILKKTKY